MFAPPVAKPKAKAAAPSKDTSTLHRAAPFGHRLDDGGAEYLRMPQRSIGNQAMLRLSRRQGLIENKHGDPGQDIGPESVSAEGGSRGLAWDFSKIPPFPPERMSGEFQSPSQFPAPRLPGPPIQAKLKVGAIDDPLEHEADRVADQVMRMPAPGVSGASTPPQVRRKGARCEGEEQLHKKPAGTLSAGREAPPIVHEVLRSQEQLFDAATRTSFDRASAPTVSWNFAAIPVYSPSSAATSPTQTRPFTATLRAIVKGRQSDALSADRHTSPAESEPRVSQSAVSKPGESKPQRKDGEPIPIPNGTLPSISGEQADSITSHLNYTSSIKNEGPPPTDFGITRYNFLPENFSYSHRAGAPGTPAGPGSPGTPATPASFEVTGDIRGAITYQVSNFGRTDIASDSDPSINQTNYPKVVADLTPPPAPVVHAGRRFMKNQPFRDHFYARDLTVQHELCHCREDVRFGGQGVQAAQSWLNTQTANSERELLALLPGIMPPIGNAVTAGRAVPADEQRAYDDGAPLYLARAQAIKRKGDANGYAPRPAPAPQPPAPAPQSPGPAPTPAGVTSGAAAGSRFGHSFGDVAVWGEQPISETSARNETALPTSQTDAGPPTPTHRVPSPPAPPPAAPAVHQCTISSRTFDTAPDGTADTRTVVGVNEIVMMTASAPSTWSATAGTIIATGASASSTWVSPASATPVSCSVTATPATGSPCSINFRVIPPRERKMTKTTDRAYTAGLAGSGFEATALILPLNVSFSGTLVREETVAGEATGYYKNVLGLDKAMHPTGTWSRVDAKNNNVKDTIGTNPPGTRGPFDIGTFFWPIPLIWRTPNDPKTFPYDNTADQIQVMMDSSGVEITAKEGADRLRTP